MYHTREVVTEVSVADRSVAENVLDNNKDTDNVLDGTERRYTL